MFDQSYPLIQFTGFFFLLCPRAIFAWGGGGGGGPYPICFSSLIHIFTAYPIQSEVQLNYFFECTYVHDTSDVHVNDRLLLELYFHTLYHITTSKRKAS